MPARDTAPAASVDSAADTLITSPTLSGWNPAAGPALLVARDAPQGAAVVFPHAEGTLSDSTRFDEAAVAGARVDLFNRVGLIGQGTVAGGFESASGGCAWPNVRIIPDEHVPPGATWTIALLAGHAAALPADSVGDISSADSVRLAKEVLRLASLVPSDVSQPFHGLPFFARTIFRFRPEPGFEALVSDVVRRISTEANPREEHTLIVAERDTASARAFDLVYHERASGPEETVIASDALAMLALGSTRLPALVLSRDDGSGTVYALLERTGARQWRVRWSSAYAGC